MEYSLSKLSEEEWKYILDKKSKVHIYKDLDIKKYIRYPGFVCNSEKQAKSYIEHIYHKYFTTVFTPPRGNISTDLQYIVVGFAPGYSDLSRGESNWLLGPSSKILIELFVKFNIFPYFTNVFKSPFKNNKINYTSELLDKSISILIDEIDFLFNTTTVINLIFLGSYKEYDEVIKRLDNPLLKINKIWHPSYILRDNSKLLDYHERFKTIIDNSKEIRLL